MKKNNLKIVEGENIHTKGMLLLKDHTQLFEAGKVGDCIALIINEDQQTFWLADAAALAYTKKYINS